MVAGDLHKAFRARVHHLRVHLARSKASLAQQVLAVTSSANGRGNGLAPFAEATRPLSAVVTRLRDHRADLRGRFIVQHTPSCRRSREHSPLRAGQGAHLNTRMSSEELSR